ncbi:MAG: HNH endonuclease [Bacteroidales bacterium]|nr:HNH endonuclease [Bacteroidales bacterium]
MPTVGEIKKGTDIGKTYRGKLVWQACIDCGKERWIQIRKEQYPRCRSCSRKALGLRGIKSARWTGRNYKTTNGYICIKLLPGDFFYAMTHNNAILEHRLIMAKYLNRCLLSWEIVHHKNGIKDDNRLENLELFPAPYQHNIISKMGRQIKSLERGLEKAEIKNADQDREIRLLKWQLRELHNVKDIATKEA